MSWLLCSSTQSSKINRSLYSPSVSLSDADFDMCVLKVNKNQINVIAQLPLIRVSATLVLTANHNNPTDVIRGSIHPTKGENVDIVQL